VDSVCHASPSEGSTVEPSPAATSKQGAQEA
jgi:hypothetical protein